MTRSHLRPIGARGRRNRAADRAWKIAVFKRYGCFCIWPACFKNANDVHHLQGKQAHPELRHVVSNGRPLCREHHRWAHANPAEARKVLARKVQVGCDTLAGHDCFWR